jgi:hypothetical protein
MLDLGLSRQDFDEPSSLALFWDIIASLSRFFSEDFIGVDAGLREVFRLSNSTIVSSALYICLFLKYISLGLLILNLLGLCDSFHSIPALDASHKVQY